MDVTDELIDRFGDPPAAVLRLIDVAMLRNTLALSGFEEISQKPQGLLLYPNQLNMETAGKLMDALPNRVTIHASARPYLLVKAKKGEKMDPVSVLREVTAALRA